MAQKPTISGPLGKFRVFDNAARFTIGNTEAKVWRYEYKSDEESNIYRALRRLDEGTHVHAEGKWDEYKGKKTFVVYDVLSMEPSEIAQDDEEVPESVKDAFGPSEPSEAPQNPQGGSPPPGVAPSPPDAETLKQARIETWAALKVLATGHFQKFEGFADLPLEEQVTWLVNKAHDIALELTK